MLLLKHFSRSVLSRPRISLFYPAISSNIHSSKKLQENDALRDGLRSNVHFRATVTRHPLEEKVVAYENEDIVQGDHTGRQQNHIWTKEELSEALKSLHKHKPETISDHIMSSLVRPSYLTV